MIAMSEDDRAAKAARARALVRTLSLEETALVTEMCRSVEEEAAEEGGRRRSRFEPYCLFARAPPVSDVLTSAVGDYAYEPAGPHPSTAPTKDIFASAV